MAFETQFPRPTFVALVRCYRSKVVPGSQVVWVVRFVQEDPKDNDSEFESFVLSVFLHELNGPNDIE